MKISTRTTAEIGRAFGEEIAASPRANWPDGILATNDHLACGVVSGLVRNGVRIPADIAVVGYDDIEFASVAAVPLTSITQPAREMGRRAGELLLDRITGGADDATGSLVFKPKLAVRASTVGDA